MGFLSLNLNRPRSFLILGKYIPIEIPTYGSCINGVTTKAHHLAAEMILSEVLPTWLEESAHWLDTFEGYLFEFVSSKAINCCNVATLRHFNCNNSRHVHFYTCVFCFQALDLLFLSSPKESNDYVILWRLSTGCSDPIPKDAESLGSKSPIGKSWAPRDP